MTKLKLAYEWAASHPWVLLAVSAGLNLILLFG